MGWIVFFQSCNRSLILLIAHSACSAIRGSPSPAAHVSDGKSSNVPVFPNATQTLRRKRERLIRLIGDFANKVRKPSSSSSRKSRRRFVKTVSLAWKVISRDSVAKRFHGPRARAMFAGLAGHSVSPLDRPPSSAFALTLRRRTRRLGRDRRKWPK